MSTILKETAEIADYFSSMRNALRLATIVTDCGKNPLAEKLEHDQVIKLEIEKLFNTANALENKYRYSGIVDKLASDFSFTLNSGFPTDLMLKEIKIDRENNGQLYNYSTLDSKEDLINKLLTKAMENKEIHRSTQFSLSIKDYMSIIKNEPVFTSSQCIEVVTDKNKADNMTLVSSHIDTSTGLPVIYIIDFMTSLPKLEERFENELKQKLLTQLSSEYKLLTIAKLLDKSFEWLHPKEITRVFLGPVYFDKFTKNTGEIDELLNESIDSKNKTLFTITVERLKSKGLKKVDGGIFSSRNEMQYDLDRLNPELFEAGITNLEQNIIMPYEVFQVLENYPNSSLHKYKKYVVAQQNHVLVF